LRDHREKANRVLQSSSMFPSGVSGPTLIGSGPRALIDFHPHYLGYVDCLIQVFFINDLFMAEMPFMQDIFGMSGIGVSTHSEPLKL